MSTYARIPEPGDEYIRVEDVKDAIEEYEARGPDEHGEVAVPFSAELYVELVELQNFIDHYSVEECILEEHFEEHIKNIIEECYDTPNNAGWPYRHMAMDWEAAADEAREDYCETTFGGYTYLCR